MITAIVAIGSMISYQYFNLKGISLDAMWFVANSFAIAVFAITSMRKSDKTFVSSISVLVTAFYSAIAIMYVSRWVMLGDGSTNYYTAICISAVLTFLYLVIHVIRSKHKCV